MLMFKRKLFIFLSFILVSSYSWSNERIVSITGATGHLGPVVVEKVLQLNPDIKVRALFYKKADKKHLKTVMDRWQYLAEQKNQSEFKGMSKRVTFKQVDVKDKDSLKNALEGSDSVIHLAAVISLGQYTHALNQEMREVNVNGVKNVLEAIEELNIQTLVHCSSAHAIKHFSDSLLGLKNGYVPIGQNSYDSTKSEAQQMIKKKDNINWAIFSPTGIIGRDDHDQTEMYPIFERHSIIRFGPIPNGRYGFIDIQQLATLLARAEQKLSMGAMESGQEFLVGGHFVPIKTFLQTLQKVTQKGHCLNWFWQNNPVEIPLSWILSLAPWMEWISYHLGYDSPLKEYNLKVLKSIPGFDPVEYEKLVDAFGEEAQLIPLEKTFEDRYAIKELNEEIKRKNSPNNCSTESSWLWDYLNNFMTFFNPWY